MDVIEKSPNLSAFQEIITKFRAHGREKSETFLYWDNFLQGADILLHLLRAERSGDFELHLNAVCMTLPWFRAADRHNYAKYVPIYVAGMKALENLHPESYQHMAQGGFVVRYTEEHSFNCVATDMALEQTSNREDKSKGGIIGFTLLEGVLTRWLKTSHITAQYSDAMKNLFQNQSGKARSHVETSKSRMDRDETDVKNIMKVALANVNPFDLNNISKELININTGQVAISNVSLALSKFIEIGHVMQNDFMSFKLVKGTYVKASGILKKEPTYQPLHL